MASMNTALRLGWVLSAVAWQSSAIGHAQSSDAAVLPPEPAAPAAATPQNDNAEPFVILAVDPPHPPANTPPASPRPARPARHELDSEAAPADDDGEWYGWQTLSVDAVSIAIVPLSAVGENGGFALVGLGGFLFAAPIVQAVHHNSWALPSLGLRAASFGLVIGGAAVALGGGCFNLGFGEDPPGCDEREAVGSVMAVGGLLGAVTSITLDAVFARSRRVDRDAPSLSMWGDPRAGTAGVSVTVVH